MGIKQKDFMKLLGIPNEEYDPTKNRLVIMFEESGEEEEFIVQIFDISESETEPSLIKELGYGILSSLHDEDFVEAIREAGKYSFNVKYPQSPKEEISYSDNIVEFKKLH
jgi:hypothetical protein|tara:strand:+ start:3990 stop:4319 length:330 start_codon:yes stop_codon:yes gene_type:complete